MNDLVRGFSYFWQGAALLRTPRLRRYVALPLIINILLFALALSMTGWWFDQTVEQWIAALPSWLHWLEWVLWIVFGALAVVVLFFTFTLVANLLSSPFNGSLAGAVQRYSDNLADPPGDDTSIVAGLRMELSKLVYMASRALVLLLVLLIPGLNVFAPVVWFVYGSWLLALQYVDYPLVNNRSDFRQARPLLRQHRLLLLGFGMGALVATLVPILNFIAMPAGVAGATLLWVGRLRGSGADLELRSTAVS